MQKSTRLPASSNINYFTPQGYEEASSELEYLKTSKRLEIVDRIQKARDLANTAENSEFDEALNEQALIETKIAYLEEALKRVKIVREKKKGDFVVIGSTVKVEMDGEIDEFMIVGKLEVDPAKKKISNESPIGKAILGAKEGEEVEVASPLVRYKCKIISIK